MGCKSLRLVTLCISSILCFGLVGCSDPTIVLEDEDWPEPFGEEPWVIYYEAVHPQGQESFGLRRDRTSIYESRGGRHLEVEFQVSEEELSSLQRELLAAGCCNYQGPWRDAEMMVGIHLRLPGLDCDVVMPGECFDSDEGTHLCGSRLSRLWDRGRPSMDPETQALSRLQQ